MNIKIPITFYFVLHLIATLIGVQSHIPINEVQTKMHYYSEANYPLPIKSYKFAIKPLYVMVVIPIQSLWYQVSHESQHTPAVFQVTALLQEPQGYLSVLGPGFGSGAYEFANSMAQRYS
jgi:hypothetical protein